MDGAPSQTDCGEARIALVEAIGEYVYQVMALARAGKPNTWTIVESALQPIVDLRAKHMHAMPTQPVAVPASHPPV